MENNFIKKNFLGKDGFRWWIGQVAPEKVQGDQLNQIGNTWGCRVKVRIYGYHPPDITELADDDLPWAQVLLSTQGGSGKANRARSLRISPGDMVMGFFLDGDDAQLPVILGIFANTGSFYGGDEEYESPFKPYTGYTSKVKPNSDFIIKNEGGDSSAFSQKSARFLNKELIDELNEKLGKTKNQLEQLLNSEDLKNNLNDASSQLNNFINSGKIEEGFNQVSSQMDGLSSSMGNRLNDVSNFLSSDAAAAGISQATSGLSDAIATGGPQLEAGLNEFQNVLNSGELQSGLSQLKNSNKEIINSLKKIVSNEDVQAFKDIGREIVLASGVKGMAENFKMTNGMKTDLKNLVMDMKNAVPQDKFKSLAGAAESIVGRAKPMINDMVNTTLKDVGLNINTGLHKLYKDEFGKIMGATGDLSLAKKVAANAQIAKIPSILGIQNAIPCAVKNITDKLLGDVGSLLADFTNNVDNFTDCIGDQFIGALFNDIIGGIDNELSGALGGVTDILGGFNMINNLRGKAEGLLGLGTALGDCDLPDADIGAKTNKWIIGVGPSKVGLENIAGKVLEIANAAQELSEAAASPGGVLGNLGIFDFMQPDVSTPGFTSQLTSCYTGPPLNCSGIQVNIFGGGGSGASASPILGAIVSDTFAEQTASLIGIKMKDMGTGYKSPPFVEITDTCNKGYGASARAIIDYDPSSPTYQMVTDIYVVSSGENYPVIEPEDDDTGEYTVDHVVVVNPGQNYQPTDNVVDDKGNVYNMFLDENGKILNVIPPDPRVNNLEPFTTTPELTVVSSTGRGAIIFAQLAPRPTYQGEVKQVIDCISPRNTGIVGFVNGEAYYGPFHVHPDRGVKMVGIAHTTTPHAVIYDTPQESRTARSTSTSTSYTTVASPNAVTMTPDETTPPSESTTMTDSTTGDGTINYGSSSSTPSSPQPPSSPPPSSPPPSSPPSSPPSGGGGGYGY